MVQWLRLYASSAGGTGLIPGLGTKIPHATCQGWVSEFSYIVNGNAKLYSTLENNLAVSKLNTLSL